MGCGWGHCYTPCNLLNGRVARARRVGNDDDSIVCLADDQTTCFFVGSLSLPQCGVHVRKSEQVFG